MIRFYIFGLALFVAISTANATGPCGKGVAAGLYADPDNCKSFWVCDVHGLPSQHYCKGTTLWNQETKKCEPPELVRCFSRTKLLGDGNENNESLSDKDTQSDETKLTTANPGLAINQKSTAYSLDTKLSESEDSKKNSNKKHSKKHNKKKSKKNKKNKKKSKKNKKNSKNKKKSKKDHKKKSKKGNKNKWKWGNEKNKSKDWKNKKLKNSKSRSVLIDKIVLWVKDYDMEN